MHIVRLLADDTLGATRERFADPLPTEYTDAFAAIESDPNQLLLVADRGGAVVGVLQITFIPGLTRLGSWRAMIEGVRVDASERGAGIGQQMVAWAIDESKRRGCRLMQLATDKTRPGAPRLFERPGVVAAPEGMKMGLGGGGHAATVPRAGRGRA